MYRKIYQQIDDAFKRNQAKKLADLYCGKRELKKKPVTYKKKHQIFRVKKCLFVLIFPHQTMLHL